MRLKYRRYSLIRGVEKTKTRVGLALTAAVLALSGGAGLAAVGVSTAGATSNNGFNQYGYNYKARNFVGTGSSWCQGKLGRDKATCDAYMGVYANDKVVMKWNAAWDACNAAGNDDVNACLGATIDNEWNGNVPGGSGETEHFKCIWVGSQGEASPYWRDGGYLIWGNYEAIMDQGMNADGHWVEAHALPNGFGVKN